MAETSQERLDFEMELYRRNKGYAPNANSPGHPANQVKPKKQPKKKKSSDTWGDWDRSARKGGPVGHRVGEQVTPNSKGGNLTGSVLGVPQMNPSTPPLSSIPSPPSVQKRPASVKKQPSKEEQMAKKIDASNKIAAAKAEDAKVAQRKSLGQPLGQPQRKPPGPPGMSQPQAPRAMVRKGGSINPQGYKRGGKVYANICRPANHSDA